jgi:hypothetical protein
VLQDHSIWSRHSQRNSCGTFFSFMLFEPYTAYTMAKFSMSMCMLGLSAELKRAGVAVNALWPRSPIVTAVIANLYGGDAMMWSSRTPAMRPGCRGCHTALQGAGPRTNRASHCGQQIARPCARARLQGIAVPNTVVISESTRKLLGNLFDLQELRAQDLKGIAGPVRAWTVKSRLDLAVSDLGVTQLKNIAEPVRVYSLEVGFHARLRDTPHTWVEWSASQLLQNTPLHPITEWSRIRFGAADVPAERRLTDLENSLAHVKLDPAENVPLLAPLLDIPVPPQPRFAIPRPLKPTMPFSSANATTSSLCVFAAAYLPQ